MTITVLTPTFNRRSKLRELWETLQKQSSKDFEWLVVDDGSTDNTKSLINQLQAKSEFTVRYIYKENGGKHTALNVGIKTIDSELTFIVDSDDTVTLDAIETILKYHHQYSGDGRLCGYVFLRQFPDGKINGKTFESNEMIANYIDARINANDTMADKAEVFITKCLKEFPFPEYSNEKFLGEDLVWIRMARKYDMVHINKVIYVGDYIEDGLTQNRRKHNIESPVGCMYRAEEFLGNDIALKYRIKGALQYVIYGKFANYKLRDLLKKVSKKFLVLVAFVPGSFLYAKWKWEYDKK